MKLFLPVLGTVVLFVSSSPAATLAHRYSFTNDTVDSVGGNDGILLGGATVDGTSLQLDGSGLSIDANRMEFTSPIDPGINFAANGLTIETWYTDTGTGTWGKLFQFGQNEVGFELAYTHSRGNGEASGVDRNASHLLGEQVAQNIEHHLVITVASDGTMNTWVDGAQKIFGQVTNAVSEIGAGVGANFEAIGATSWADPGMLGAVNEFRIWDGELTPLEVATNFANGPNLIAAPDDIDGDGLPDAWEELWFGEGNLDQGPDDDPDGDGLTNLEEFEFNPQLDPDEADTDGDGLEDGFEVGTSLTDPLDDDSDDDTLLDGEEINTHMTDPLLADSDMDFYPDNQEIAMGTNPNDPGDPLPLEKAELAHRYSFGPGTELVDSVGGNTGVLLATATVTGGQLQLDGAGTGPGASSMQFTAPIDIGTNFGGTGVSIETWYTDTGSDIWAKLFTFGTSTVGQEISWTNFRGGEDLAPGLDREGAKPLASIPFGSDDRLERNVEHHLVLTVAADGTINMFVDGTREMTDVPSNALGNVVATTESIGSTTWNDPGHLGTVNEFRIWRGEMTEVEVAQSRTDGPDSIGGLAPLAITNIELDSTSGVVTLTWRSIDGHTYAIDSTTDLQAREPPSWREIDDGVNADSDSTQFEHTPPVETPRIFYRVRDVTL